MQTGYAFLSAFPPAVTMHFIHPLSGIQPNAIFIYLFHEFSFFHVSSMFYSRFLSVSRILSFSREVEAMAMGCCQTSSQGRISVLACAAQRWSLPCSLTCSLGSHARVCAWISSARLLAWEAAVASAASGSQKALCWSFTLVLPSARSQSARQRSG